MHHNCILSQRQIQIYVNLEPIFGPPPTQCLPSFIIRIRCCPRLLACLGGWEIHWFCEELILQLSSLRLVVGRSFLDNTPSTSEIVCNTVIAGTGLEMLDMGPDFNVVLELESFANLSTLECILGIVPKRRFFSVLLLLLQIYKHDKYIIYIYPIFNMYLHLCSMKMHLLWDPTFTA